MSEREEKRERERKRQLNEKDNEVKTLSKQLREQSETIDDLRNKSSMNLTNVNELRPNVKNVTMSSSKYAQHSANVNATLKERKEEKNNGNSPIKPAKTKSSP